MGVFHMRSHRRVSRDETSPVTVTSAVIVTETAARMTCPSPPAACTDIAPCQVGAAVPSHKCRVDLVPLPRHPAGSPLGSPLHRQQLRREPVLGGAHRPGAGPERAAARRLHCSVLLQVRVCRGKYSGHNTAYCRREHLLPGPARQQTSIILQGEAEVARPGPGSDIVTQAWPRGSCWSAPPRASR